MPSDHLESLDWAAKLAYEAHAFEATSRPERTSAALDTIFHAKNIRERLRIIADTCKSLLSTDGCEMSVVLPDRQVDIATGIETPYAGSFCKFVVAAESKFVVESAETNSLVCEAATVIDLGIRAYLGLPMIFNGQYVGALCVFQNEPRVWKPAEVQILASFAATTTREISIEAAR